MLGGMVNTLGFPGENEVQLEMTMEPMEELDFEEDVHL